MFVLLIIGLLALVFGGFLVFAPQVVTKITAWSNQLIARTDDIVHSNNKAAGALLILAGIFILVVFFMRR